MSKYTSGKTTQKRDKCIQRKSSEISALKAEIDALKAQNADLLAALQAMVGEYGEFYGDTPEVAAQSQSPLIKSALAAIAKARGDL